MAVEFGQLDRNMRGLTIGRIKAFDDRKAQRLLEGLQEYEDQFRIDISGTTGTGEMTWQTQELAFNVEFVDAPAQRNIPWYKPHFTYGAYVERGGPVEVTACITRWVHGDRNEVTGCVIAIGVGPTDEPRKFRGEVHARFQGYGAPAEEYGDPSIYDVG